MIPPFDPSAEHVFVFTRYTQDALREELSAQLTREGRFLHYRGTTAGVITAMINDGWELKVLIGWACLTHPDHERTISLSAIAAAFARFVLARNIARETL